MIFWCATKGCRKALHDELLALKPPEAQGFWGAKVLGREGLEAQTSWAFPLGQPYPPCPVVSGQIGRAQFFENTKPSGPLSGAQLYARLRFRAADAADSANDVVGEPVRVELGQSGPKRSARE